MCECGWVVFVCMHEYVRWGMYLCTKKRGECKVHAITCSVVVVALRQQEEQQQQGGVQWG